MRKVLPWIVLVSACIAFLNWKVVHLTRWERPEWKEWMHAHERQYKTVIDVIRYGCPPAAALEPLFFHAAMSVEASQEEIDALTHAERPDWQGFYHLVDRRYSWTFVPWLAWFTYWTPFTVVWWMVVRRFV